MGRRFNETSLRFDETGDKLDSDGFGGEVYVFDDALDGGEENFFAVGGADEIDVVGARFEDLFDGAEGFAGGGDGGQADDLVVVVLVLFEFGGLIGGDLDELTAQFGDGGVAVIADEFHEDVAGMQTRPLHLERARIGSDINCFVLDELFGVICDDLELDLAEVTKGFEDFTHDEVGLIVFGHEIRQAAMWNPLPCAGFHRAADSPPLQQTRRD